MDRKEIAKETLEIMHKGFFEYKGKRIDLKEEMEQSIQKSDLITPKQGEQLLEDYKGNTLTEEKQLSREYFRVEMISTVDAIWELTKEGQKEIGVLNFASAKHPGGGFLNGAMAQEESLAASSTLYKTLTAHEEYYSKNRSYPSMTYTDYGIYSPDVLFFRDGNFQLTDGFTKASVLTLPAVNMRQILQKGEDIENAKRVMKRRMHLSLAIFAKQKAKHLILGAYGCGVFGNDPKEVANWWKNLLEEGMAQYFDSIFFAVLDHSRKQECIAAFRQVFGFDH